MIDKVIVNQIVDEFISGADLYLVDLKIGHDNRISIEIDSMQGVSLDDCVELNRFIESKLDREIEDYELEVSSAGLTEPFKVLKQYEKNKGREVEVLTLAGKKLSGILQEANQQNFTVLTEQSVKQEGAKRKTVVQTPVVFKYDEIKYSKLIIRFK
jgi:ribosome maturation factor RimP